jgi:RNA polymerase sigma factor (sigma-70 family)
VKVSTIGHLQTLFNFGTIAATSDGLLLERFVAQRDGPAFEAILARHGPMVLSVCRRMLPELSDVEDAFQATFLILVLKAGTLRDRQRLGPWLYGVAHRVATRSRAQADHRRSRERPATDEPSAETFGDVEHRELLAVLDDEVARLPEKYRAAVVLCDLEGQTDEEAARQLGCALGTVKSRLASARKRLRDRLIHRGFAPSAVTLFGGIAAGTARAAVPAALSASAVRAALEGAAARAAGTGAVSASVLTLTQGVLTIMFLARFKTIGAILFAVGTCAAGLGVLAQPPTGSKYDEPIRHLEAQLEHFKRIRQMEIDHKEAQDKTAAQLHKLGAAIDRDVVVVNLVSTPVTDDDLKALTVFHYLQALHLHHTKISDAGVANLKSLKSLTTLDLFDTRVTDAGLAHLAEWMPHLEWLELSDTQVTDAGLRSIVGLKHLRRLDVRKTKVTAAGAEELHRALPGVEILH